MTRLPPFIIHVSKQSLLTACKDQDLERQTASSSSSDGLVELDSPVEDDFLENKSFSWPASKPQDYSDQHQHQQELHGGSSPVPLVVSDLLTDRVEPVQQAAPTAFTTSAHASNTKNALKRKRKLLIDPRSGVWSLISGQHHCSVLTFPTTFLAIGQETKRYQARNAK